MIQLETQVAKIQIGNQKQAQTFAFVMAETSPNSQAEVFLVCELPLLNPAALPDCQRICQAIAASIMRTYRREINENTFENALAEINEELGKLASLGQTHWINKLNSVIAVRSADDFSIAATGKISALLLRDEQFANLADSPKVRHPLKTFENFAVGKLRLQDIMILSTTQLLNHLSVDRLKNLLSQYALPLAGQQIIKILQDNAGPEITVGTLILRTVEPGTTTEQTADLADFAAAVAYSPGFIEKLKSFWRPLRRAAKSVAYFAGLLGQKLSAVPRIPKTQAPTPAAGASPKAKIWERLQNKIGQAKTNFAPAKIKAFSPAKKFFLISALVLLAALIVNLAVTSRYKGSKSSARTFAQSFGQVQKSLNDANAAILYNDEDQARNFLKSALDTIAALGKLGSSQKQEIQGLQNQIADLKTKLDKNLNVTAATLTSLGQSENLIKLPNFLAVQSGQSVISYNLTSGQTQDGALKTPEIFSQSAYLKDTIAAIRTKDGLRLWNYGTGQAGEAFSQNVPAQEQSIGLVLYPVNKRVYTINKQNSEILSFLPTAKSFGNPVISVQNQGDLSDAQDMAIDGAIYVLSGNKIIKFLNGQLSDFKLSALSVPLGNKGKLFTQRDFKHLYILDSNNNRVVIVDKTGRLVQVLLSEQFNKPADFNVDEKNKTIYVLNNGTLLKVNF